MRRIVSCASAIVVLLLLFVFGTGPHFDPKAWQGTADLAPGSQAGIYAARGRMITAVRWHYLPILSSQARVVSELGADDDGADDCNKNPTEGGPQCLIYVVTLADGTSADLTFEFGGGRLIWTHLETYKDLE